ncbi:hypothetical protein ABHD89_000124 [Salinicoccus halitifaciens]|uniref:Transcriptional regulator n=1 Tax=Salinicoccus halitifaciens TaxID=1073415 RepID=A0ABV2E5Q9_9STAP
MNYAIKAENAVLRRLFNEWYELSNKPNLRLVSEGIGLNYNTFVSWKTGKHDYSRNSLREIRKYFYRLSIRQEQINQLYEKVLQERS